MKIEKAQILHQGCCIWLKKKIFEFDTQPTTLSYFNRNPCGFPKQTIPLGCCNPSIYICDKIKLVHSVMCV